MFQVGVTDRIIEEEDNDEVPFTEKQKHNSIDYAGMVAKFRATFEEFPPDVYDDMKESAERIISLIKKKENPIMDQLSNGIALFKLYEDMFKKGNELSDAQRIQMLRNGSKGLGQMYLEMIASDDVVQLMMKHLDDDPEGIIKGALEKLSQSLGVSTETLIKEFKNHKSIKLSRKAMQQLLRQMYLAEDEDDDDSWLVEFLTGESKDQPRKQSKEVEEDLQKQKQKHAEKEEEKAQE